MNNINNFELTIIAEGIQATTNGACAEKVSVTAKGAYGNEIVSVIGDLLNRALDKHPTITPTTTIVTDNRGVKKVVEKTPTTSNEFCEVETPETSIFNGLKESDTIQASWDLGAVWRCLEATMPKTDRYSAKPTAGFEKKGVGCYEYFNPDETDEVRVQFKLRSDNIELVIDGNILSLDENPKFNNIIGIHRSLVPELIASIKDEDCRKVVEGFVEKVLKK